MPTKYSFISPDAFIALSMSEWNPNRSIAKPVELRNVGLRQADQRGDDPHRDRHEDLFDQVRPLGVREPVDGAFHQRADQLGFPPPHR